MPEERAFEELSYLREEVRRLRASLNRLTPRLEIILRRRGFRIYKKEPSEDLLIPSAEFVDDYYTMLHKYSFRLFLREVIKHQNFFTLREVTRYATAEVTGEYLHYISRLGLVSEKNGGYALGRRIKSFGETLEWYVAEVFEREFGAESVWGVKFRRRKVGGDYDVIAKFDGSLFYVEVKSSPPRQIYDNEIAAFLDRVSDLSPEIAAFFMDTELRMKDKIVPMFEAELKRRSPVPPEVRRMEKELFQISGRIFIVNAKESIVGNIERVLSRYFRR
jgi:Holliday junction resolvase-like predicted endonuclease